MRHPTPRQFSGALLGALAVMALQGCKRDDILAAPAPSSPPPTTYLEDQVLTLKIRTALLLSPVLHSVNVGVQSHGGAVLLSGMATNTTQIDLALFVAQTVPGVTSVDSFMFAPAPAPTVALNDAAPTQGLQAPKTERLQVSLARDASPRVSLLSAPVPAVVP